MPIILPYRGICPTIAEDAFIAPSAVIVGDVTIASGASVWFGTVIRADSAPVRIGPRSNVQDNCVIHTDEGAPCEIGAECSLGHSAVVHGATIGDGTLIGMHATVLTSAAVGAGSLLAAGALLPEGKNIAAGYLAMGTPARAVRPVTDEERARMRRGIEHYRAYAVEYARALREAEESAGE